MIVYRCVGNPRTRTPLSVHRDAESSVFVRQLRAAFRVCNAPRGEPAVQVCAMSLLAALNPVGARRLRIDGKSWLGASDGPARPPVRLASAWSRVMRGLHPDPAARQRTAELARANSF